MTQLTSNVKSISFLIIMVACNVTINVCLKTIVWNELTTYFSMK